MIKRPILLMLAALCAACSQLPGVELQAYRNAFQAAQTAAEPMISDYAAAERAQRLARLQSENSGRQFTVDTPFFATFQPTDALAVSRVGLPPGAQAVRHAFDSIAAYNDTLVALAEGRNIDEAQGQIGEVISNIGGIVPGAQAATAVAGAVANILGNVLRPLAAADNRAEFRRIVLEGYDPMVGLIDLLIAHSGDQYSTTINPYLTQIELGEGDRNALISRINAWHQAFADYVVLLDAMKDQLAALKGAVENPGSAPLLARASAGAAELRGHADTLRGSVGALRSLP